MLLCSPRMQQFIVAAPELALKVAAAAATSSQQSQARPARPLHANVVAIPYDSHIHWSLVRTRLCAQACLQQTAHDNDLMAGTWPAEDAGITISLHGIDLPKPGYSQAALLCACLHDQHCRCFCYSMWVQV